MATKPFSGELGELHNRLKRHKKENESFSEVIKRIIKPL